ncbi:pyridoxal phosphate-dependent aminotransferase [Haladaptatus halobius]|uniref:pyridoxal phosphate-dependent aminotransferase n=1 Tax=Haladaptatus halobius TaxID=2884875 RepID=UPI001D0A7107|nr:pyridoxal phosphate-dependent aminotransferase [Haladaptatus halobius]
MSTIERSKIRVMYDLAQEANNEDLIHFEIWEPDFDTPTHIIEAVTEAAHAGATHYTSNVGLPALREVIATKMATENEVEIDPDREVTVTNGAMEALYLALQAVVAPGDEVVIPTPGWPNYRNQVRLAGGVPVYVPLPADRGFEMDASRVTDAISDATAAVIICTPSNPTGRVYDFGELETIVRAAALHDAYVIIDEVYEGLIFEGSTRSVAAEPAHFDTVLSVNSCSKKYAMTGWRLGWLAGPESVVRAATVLHESTTACAPSVSQHAAIAALTGSQKPIRAMKDAYEMRRDYLVDRIADIPHISCPRPEGGFYAFVDVSALDGSSFEIAKRLLYDHGVVTAPGDGFGDAGEGYLRLSFATGLEHVERGCDRIETMVTSERE